MTPLVTFTAAELLALTDQDLDQLEALAGDEERKALWWQLWRLEREENERRARARVKERKGMYTLPTATLAIVPPHLDTPSTSAWA
jgi:hypothetical protein